MPTGISIVDLESLPSKETIINMEADCRIIGKEWIIHQNLCLI
jgi:hypothetical protein